MRLIKHKIKTAEKLKDKILSLKKQDKKIAFTNGCFDVIHSGHVSYLQRAKAETDILIVALNCDSSVTRIKGKGRPVIKLKDRMQVVAALESVDFVTHFNQDTPFEIIKALKPDILIKGGDWKKNKVVGRDIVESYGGKVLNIPYIKGYSSSAIIKRIGSAHS